MWRIEMTRTFRKSFRRLHPNAQKAIDAFVLGHRGGIEDPEMLPNINKLKGHPNVYRLLFGQCRVGVWLDAERRRMVLDFAGARGDFYKGFP